MSSSSCPWWCLDRPLERSQLIQNPPEHVWVVLKPVHCLGFIFCWHSLATELPCLQSELAYPGNRHLPQFWQTWWFSVGIGFCHPIRWSLQFHVCNSLFLQWLAWHALTITQSDLFCSVFFVSYLLYWIFFLAQLQHWSHQVVTVCFIPNNLPTENC